jgi:hypothetical protein
MHLDEVAQLELPQWLPLSDAQELLFNKLQVGGCEKGGGQGKGVEG